MLYRFSSIKEKNVKFLIKNKKNLDNKFIYYKIRTTDKYKSGKSIAGGQKNKKIVDIFLNNSYILFDIIL